ncbi:MAG: outer membrane protein assembly factor BamD [Thermodesulfobacteriota bacterium]
MPRSLRASIPRTVLLLFLFLFSAGCSEKLSRQAGLTDAGLYARGQQRADRGKHEEAAEAFQLLIERFPTSPLAPRAQFGLASSRMANKEKIEAEVAFDDYLRLYPGDSRVPDALFLKGDLLFGQILAPGRSQDRTREAIESYRKFLEKEPGTERSATAAARIRELRGRLALHEKLVVVHYLKRKLYLSAELRAQRAVAEYPDTAAAPGLYSLLAEAMEKQGKKEEASRVLRTLEEKYPQHGGGKR